MNVTFDNLGGNISLGYSGCTSTYFCRICEITRAESKTTTIDDLSKYRTKDNYAIALDIIETSTKVDIKETKGIVRYCVLNDLKYFHILDNFNADIMHDLAEGVMPWMLQNIFKYCIKSNLLTEEELRNKALFHDYGVLNSRNIPSSICFDRRNIGQNASQQKCLVQNLPFILQEFKYDPRLIKVWPCVTSLLEILRIVYNANITECDLVKLEAAVSNHMERSIEHFPAVNLLLKHHFMLHYANIIRAVGPVVHMSTMRYEMQHKNFTKYAHRSNNFVNVTKSLATNFQKSKLLETPYRYETKSAKLKNIPRIWCENYENTLLHAFGSIENILITKWLQTNNNYYRKELILKNNQSMFCEIDEILFLSGKYFFLCHELALIEFDTFLCSVEILECLPRNYLVLEENSLQVKKSFPKKNVNGRFYIAADCLDIPVEKAQFCQDSSCKN